jgi:thiol-disulfide isomerase/thioredoxin
VAGLGLALVAFSGAGAQESGIEVGTKAPGAALHTLDGKPAELGDLIGKQPVLMEFWAVWCPSCKELEPTMKAMHAKYGKKVTFVGVAVSVNQSPALVQKYVDKYKLPGIQFFDTRGKATEAYDVAATSFVVLVDKTGKVVYTGSGGKQDLEAALKKVM